MLTYRDILQKEFERRRSANANYSLRAFARDLAMAPSRLSEVLNNRRGLSEDKGEAIARRLRYSKSMRDYFVTSIGAEHGRSAQRRALCKERLATMPPIGDEFRDKLEKSYNVVAWYYGALMELPRVLRRNFSLAKAASKLGISQFQVEAAARYLKRLEYWTEAEKPGPKRKLNRLGLPERLLRLNYQQVLTLAAEHVPADREEGWEYEATCFAFSKNDLPQVEDILRTAQRELHALAQTSANPDAVYLYATQFFKLTKGEP